MYNSKLDELRNRWKLEPNNRTIIEIQAKLIKMAMELEEKEKKSEKNIIKIAEEIFK